MRNAFLALLAFAFLSLPVFAAQTFNVSSTVDTPARYAFKFNYTYVSGPTDFSNLTLTCTNGTVLPYYVQQYAPGAWASIWTYTCRNFNATQNWNLFDLATDSAATANASNPYLVFPFYDGFEQASINTTFWNTAASGSLTTSLKVYGSKAVNISANPSLTSTFNHSRANFRLDWWAHYAPAGTAASDTWGGLGDADANLISLSAQGCAANNSKYNPDNVCVAGRNQGWNNATLISNGSSVYSFLNGQYKEIHSGASSRSSPKFYSTSGIEWTIDEVIVRDWVSAEPTTVEVSTAVITRLNQTPSDLNSSNFAAGASTYWEVLNANNTPTLGYAIGPNLTTPYAQWLFVNGTGFGGFFLANSTNSTPLAYPNTTYFVYLGDNMVAPATYPLSPVVYFDSPFRVNLTQSNDAVAFRLFNITNKNYSFLEFMATNYTSGTNNLQVWARNQSCIGTTVATSYCQVLIANIPAGTPYNHCHNNTNNCHMLVPLSINSNLLLGVNVSTTMEFVLKPQLGTGADWSVYYFNVTTYPGQTQTTSTGGLSWTNATFTVNAHAHQFQAGDTLLYYMNASVNGTQRNSTLYTDVLEQGALPPSAVTVTSPAGLLSNYTFSNYSVNFTNASVIVDYFLTYNVTVESTDHSIVYERLLTNSSVNTTTWNASKLNSGSYLLTIVAIGWPSGLSSETDYPVLLYGPGSAADSNLIESAYHNFTYFLPVSSLIFDYLSVNLTLNGTTYQGVLGDSTVSYDYFVPQITTPTTVLPFNWTVQYNATNGSIVTYVTDTFTSLVTQMNISRCEFGNFTLNVSFFDETTGSPVTGVISTTNFAFRNTPMRGNLTRYWNETYTLGGSTYAFCLLPQYANYSSDLFFDYEATGYADRQYSAEANLSNTTQFLSLYLLNSSAADQTIITVVDGVNTKVPGIVIKAQRWIPANNTYLTVASGTTDYKGEVELYLEVMNEYYRFLLEQNGVVIKTISPYIITCAAGTSCPPYRFTLQINLAENPPLFEQAGSLSSSCNFTNATEYFVCLTNDATGLSTNFQLIVTKKLAVSWNQTCSVTCASTACVMPCLLGNHTGQIYEYTLYSTTTKGGTVAIQHGFLDFTGSRTTWDYNGLLLALLVTLTLAFSCAWNPTASLVAGAGGVVFGYLAGLLPVSIGSLIGFLFVIGVLAWNSRT